MHSLARKNCPDPTLRNRKHCLPEQQQIARLKAENERLKRENNNLLEQFNRWVYNGYLKTMDERMREFMNTFTIDKQGAFIQKHQSQYKTK
jgi:cell division protein FtsB